MEGNSMPYLLIEVTHEYDEALRAIQTFALDVPFPERPDINGDTYP